MIKFTDVNNKPAIKFIALHHTAVFNNGVPQLAAVDEYHKNKDWGGGWTQPGPSAMGWYVAYNFFCDSDGVRTQTREVGEETLAQRKHNCDIEATCDTISYCMSGDFRIQMPTSAQEGDFVAFINEVRLVYPNIQVVGHRDLDAGRTCPELSKEYIDKFNKKLDAPDTEKAEIIEKLQRELVSSRAESTFLTRLLRGCK